jgi:predicted short-subunit dehydrogenase-like oxidoreductase (DUF2520 family)
MNIAIHGPGRAGGALAIAASAAGHTIVSVQGRNADAVDHLASIVDVRPGTPDLAIIAVTDDAIAVVAAGIAAHGPTVHTVHISGAVPVSALDPISDTGVQVGSLHPLQTLPDPQRGAEQLAGAWMAVTAHEPLRTVLNDFVISLACRPFDLSDDAKPLYHAGAAAAANYTLTTLHLALALFEAAGVPFEAARPLVETIVANAFEMGPAEALTGPVARGDAETVARQIAAIREQIPQAEEVFIDLARATAAIAGTSATIDEALR